MIITGTKNSATIFADEIESSAVGQITALCNLESMSDSKIRIMPDVHAGKGCVIGTTMTITDKIIPNLVGVDIGCGVLAVRFSAKTLDFNKLDKTIRAEIPAGITIRQKTHRFSEEAALEELICSKHIDADRAIHSVGTLGSGNHYIEVDTDESGSYYLVIHSGSRYLGVQVAEHYQNIGIKECSVLAPNIPAVLAHIAGQTFEDYLHDMKRVQHFATLNRRAIADVILKAMKWKKQDEFETVHNYIDTDNMILRKGSISAQLGENVIIPLNMRDGSLICIGKGNEEWNYSAPHGAGRLMTRTDAKNGFTVTQYKAEMKGIYSSCISKGTIDESPMAYKSIDFILSKIGDTVDVVNQIKPLYNFKAG